MLLLGVMMLYAVYVVQLVHTSHCQSALAGRSLAINCYSIACSPRASPGTSNIKPFAYSEDRDFTMGWELGWTGRRALYNPSPSIILPHTIVWVIQQLLKLLQPGRKCILVYLEPTERV